MIDKSTLELIKNPYKDIKISIIIPSIDFVKFSKVIDTLSGNSPNCKHAEILVKIDETIYAAQYENLLRNSIFAFKIMLYPSFNKRYSCLHFYNDLASIASGDIIWQMPDDSAIVHGDWYKVLLNTRNTFSDNIYVISIPMDNGKGAKQIIGAPAITKEWLNFFGCVSPMPNTDRWLHELPKNIGRRIVIKESDLLMHFPEGGRVLSKKDRKELFFPAVEKYKTKFLQYSKSI